MCKTQAGKLNVLRDWKCEFHGFSLLCHLFECCIGNGSSFLFLFHGGVSGECIGFISVPCSWIEGCWAKVKSFHRFCWLVWALGCLRAATWSAYPQLVNCSELSSRGSWHRGKAWGLISALASVSVAAFGHISGIGCGKRELFPALRINREFPGTGNTVHYNKK